MLRIFSIYIFIQSIITLLMDYFSSILETKYAFYRNVLLRNISTILIVLIMTFTMDGMALMLATPILVAILMLMAGYHYWKNPGRFTCRVIFR